MNLLAHILKCLEKHYGKLRFSGPTDPYEMLLYANSGYPANDTSCPKGFDALRKLVGLKPEEILAASEHQLAQIMRLGGIFPELRARRIKEIAARVKERFGGDLDKQLENPIAAKKILKQFPTIADSGAEKILLFSNHASAPAIPSGQVHVLHRLGFGAEQKSYAAGYRSAQAAIEAALPQKPSELKRAYLLIQRHGREICKRNQPRCHECPVSMHCKYFRRMQKG